MEPTFHRQHFRFLLATLLDSKVFHGEVMLRNFSRLRPGLSPKSGVRWNVGKGKLESNATSQVEASIMYVPVAWNDLPGFLFIEDLVSLGEFVQPETIRSDFPGAMAATDRVGSLRSDVPSIQRWLDLNA